MGKNFNLENSNQGTQPQIQHAVFNNWKIIPRGWYYLFKSSEVKSGQIKSTYVGKQKLVVFRNQSGEIGVLDSFCPHMGADLSIGRVKGDHIQCFFHHWEYNKKGTCVKIACQEKIPDRTKVDGYACAEKYGAIWVFPDQEADAPLLEVPGLEGKEVIAAIGVPNISQSHHHISMINGIDPQHLATVHQLDIQMDLNVSEEKTQISFVLEGDTPSNNFTEKVMKFFIGERYSYAMKYADACLASLTVMRNVYFLRKKWKWPELHMLYAYRPSPDNKSYTFPIYVTEKKPGFLGGIKSYFKLWMTKKLYFFLKDEDEIIYDNIRFNPRTLLPMDGPVTRYIGYVNRLKPSKWSDKESV